MAKETRRDALMVASQVKACVRDGRGVTTLTSPETLTDHRVADVGLTWAWATVGRHSDLTTQDF